MSDVGTIDPEEREHLYTQFFNGTAVPEKQPQFFVITGPPATGKTSFYERQQEEGNIPPAAHIHDPDAVIQALSGYQEDSGDLVKAFSRWELPARELADEMVLEAVARGVNIIYGRTLAQDSAVDVFNQVRQAGYKLVLNGVYADLPVALERAAARELETKRHTPPEVITERHERFCQRWPMFVELSDEATLYLNNTPDDRFRPIARKEKGEELRILDQAAYAPFIRP